jgi:colanic acid/amylovoran biosynthesis glycosyltransferase
LKIAFLVNSFPSISETFIYNQIKRLKDLGYEVEVFSFHNPKEEIDIRKKDYDFINKVNYINIPRVKSKRILSAIYIIIRSFFKYPLFTLKSLNILKYKKEVLSLRQLWAIPFFIGKKFDILHCCFGRNGIIGAVLRDIGVIKVKVVTSFHGYDLSGFVRKKGSDVYDFLFKNGDLFLPVSTYLEKKLIKLGCEENRIHVHRMGINLSEFKHRKRKYNKKYIKFLTIGRLVKKKGVYYAIKAIARLIKKYPNIKYCIIGDGPEKRSLDNLIKNLKIEKNVSILGFMDHKKVVKMLESSDILLAPSVEAEDGDEEGIPNVIKEAMAVGIPVVSTFHSGIPEIIENGTSGLLAIEKDINEMINKIQFLIENRNIWENMIIAGRKIVEEHYNSHKLIYELIRLYNSLLNPNRL